MAAPPRAQAAQTAPGSLVPLVAADGVWVITDSLFTDRADVAVYIQAPGADPLDSRADIEVLCQVTADGLTHDPAGAGTRSQATFEHLRGTLDAPGVVRRLLESHRADLAEIRHQVRSDTWEATDRALHRLQVATGLPDRATRAAGVAMIQAGFTGSADELAVAATAAAAPAVRP